MNILRKPAALVAALVVLSTAPGASAQVQPDVNVALPGVELGDVTVLGPSSAVVSATVDPNGLTTNAYVEYGSTSALGLVTPTVTIAAGAEPTKLLADLVDLSPNSTYYYRVVAESPLGTSTSSTGQFQTPPATVNPNTGQLGASGRGLAKCTIVGTARADRLKGTRGNDVICGLGGSDRINGLGGSDVVYGGAGNDRIVGGKGNDRLIGNAGKDRLVGSAGRDRLIGLAGRDRLVGGKGADRLVASRDRRKGDRANGGPGRDTATVNRGDKARKVERVRRRG